MPTEYEYFIDTAKEIVEAARAKRSLEVVECVTAARKGEDVERSGFIEEFATQYGFEYLDGDCEILFCSRQTLADVASVLGFRTSREHREANASQPKKEEHMPETAEAKCHEEEKITRDQIIRLEALRAALARSTTDTKVGDLVADAQSIYGFLCGDQPVPNELSPRKSPLTSVDYK